MRWVTQLTTENRGEVSIKFTSTYFAPRSIHTYIDNSSWCTACWSELNITIIAKYCRYTSWNRSYNSLSTREHIPYSWCTTYYAHLGISLLTFIHIILPGVPRAEAQCHGLYWWKGKFVRKLSDDRLLLRALIMCSLLIPIKSVC